MKKRLLLTILPVVAFFCLFSVKFVQPSMADTMKVTFLLETDEYAKQGDTFDLKISVNVQGGSISSFDFDMKYNSSLLEYVSYNADYKTSNSDSNIMKLSDGTLRALFAGDPLEQSSFVPSGKTLLYTVKFKVKSGAQIGTASFSMTGIVANNASIQEIPAANVTAGSTSINIIKLYSDDNTLKSLTVSAGTLSPSFSPAQLSYTVSVPYSVTSITINAGANHSAATVSGDIGKALSLDVGTKTFKITVKAQDGTEKTYTVAVTREKCTDNTLKSLTVNTGTLSPAFSSSVLNYNVNVPYTTTSITLTAAKNHATATVSGDGAKTLAVGKNTFTITVTAQNGEKKTYTVTVTRAAASNDNTLKSLTVSTGTLSPSFSSSQLSYTVSVPYSVTSITISAGANHSAATVSGDIGKALSLSVGTKTFSITVKAQDGSTKTYTVTVTRQKCTDNTLKSLSVSGYKFTEDFSPSKTDYITVNIPYITGTITINAVKNHDTATVEGTGTKTLSAAGGEVFEIKVTAQNGDVRIYRIKVVKSAPSKDNTLKSLTVNTGTLSPAFSSSVLNYNVNVPYTTTSITLTAVKNHAAATVSGDGAKTLAVGKNTFTITVTAQSGDKKTYTVTVTRAAASNDNTLKSLTVNTGTLSPAFSSSVLIYNVNVPYTTTSITLTAVKNHALATVSGDGAKTLAVGKNTFTITVKAQNNEKKTYTVIVTRQQSSDNTLKSLTINNGKLTPSFNKNTTEYIVLVPYTVSSVKINYTLNDSAASATPVGGVINKQLVVGVNEITITVKAQNGNVKVYKITVSREAPSTDNALKSLTVSKSSLSPSFSPSNLFYTVNVGYEADSIEIKGIANHIAATVSGDGKKILKVGENIFYVDVTAQNNESKTYTVKVIREAPTTDSTLKSLSVKGYPFPEEFSPSLFSYTVTVPYSVTAVTVEAVKNDNNATVSIQGDKKLSVGENKIIITVTAQDGSVQTYTINVTRTAASGNSALKSLTPSVGQFDEIFDPEVTVYNITVGYKIKAISFDWETADPYANVYITGNDELEAGEVNVFTLTVTAQDNSKTYYIINVTRAFESDDTTLSSLEVGGTRFTFDPDIREYDIGVPLGVAKADIRFTLSSEYASAVLEGDVNLSKDKVNIFTITVTAENGSRGIYTLRISYREIESDTSLKSLEDSEGLIEFIPTAKNYSIKVPYSVNVITLKYTLGGKYSTAVLSGPEKLAAGEENVYTITVTAEDASTAVYKVTVFRMLASDDSALKNLEVKGFEIEPAFDPSTVVYSVYIPYSVESIELVYSTSHKFATVELSKPEILEAGKENIFTVKVISESGNETAVYTVKVYRDVISEDSSLSGLEVKGADTEPEFSPDELNYSVTVPYITDKAEFIYKTNHMGASGILEGPEELEVGENIYKITVTAETGSQTVYTVTVVRSEKDSDSTLSKLVPSSGEIDFDPLVTEYNMTVGYHVTEMTFEYVTNSPYANVMIAGNKMLEAGKINSFVISVVAEDGSVTDYRINVMRALLSGDSSASSITVMGEELDIASGKTDFTIDVPYGTAVAEVTASANDEKASVEIKRENEVLAVGKNVITVIVTAEDGTFTEYNINIIRDAGSSNAYLEIFGSENGSFNEKFDPNKLNYTMTVDQTVSKFVPIIKTAHEKATFRISDTNLAFGENVITVTVTSENGNVMQYKVRVTRERDSIWKVMTENVMFSIGGLGITVFMFVAAALAVIVICVIILIIVKKRSSENRR